MSWQHDTNSFFASDGDQGNNDEDLGLELKGEYNRGSTPPSNLPTSPDSPASPHSPNHTKKSNPPSATYTGSTTSGHYTAESDTMPRKKDYDGYSLSRSRSNSRSPTYSRSRSRSPTYSDSFDSEDSRQDSRRASPVRTKKNSRGRTSNTTTSRFNSGSSRDSRTTYRSTYSTNYTSSTRQPKKGTNKGASKKRGGGGGGGRSQSVSTIQQSPRNNDVAKRMLSAKGHTINRLRSEVDDLRRKYDEAVRENKLMKQLQRRQEAALSKYTDPDEELPQMLRQHSAEMDNLRERLRRTQDREKDKERRLKNKNEELNRLNDEVGKLRRLADDKRLLDRDKLQRKLDKLQDTADDKDRKIEELEKYVENLKKNEKFGGDQWRVKEKDYRGTIAHLEDENKMLNYQLKEKEKELEIRNIYSNRLIKPPAKLNTSVTPPPQRPLSQTRATSNEDLVRGKPPLRASLKRSSSAEDKQRSERALREEHTSPEPPQEAEKKEKREVKKEEKRELSEHEKILQELDSGFQPHPPPRKPQDDVLTDLDGDIKRREREEERRKREREEQDKKRRAEEEERRRKEAERKRREEEQQRQEEEERKPHGRLSFFSDAKTASKASPRNNQSDTASYKPSFLTNTSTSSSSKPSIGTNSYKPTFAPASKTETKTDSYKPSLLVDNKIDSSKPSLLVDNKTDSSKPSLLVDNNTAGRGESLGLGFVKFDRQEEKGISWFGSGKEEKGKEKTGSTADFFGERERKQKEEEALVKSSTFVTESSPSVSKNPAFIESDDEENVPFFGSKPRAFQPSKPAGNQAAVNSVRDLHKYSSNSRHSSGSRGNSRETDEDSDYCSWHRKKTEADFAAQRKKQKEEAERLAEERKKKDMLIARMREIDGKPESRGSKKEYKFTQPIENLHHGKPSHPDLQGSPAAAGKKPAADSDAAFGGYAPSFGRRAPAGDKPPAKKGGLFDEDDDSGIFAPPKAKQGDNSNRLRSDLFSETKADSPSKNRSSLEGTVFSNSTKAKPVADSNLLPWEKKGTTGNAFTQSNKPNGMTVNVPKSSFDDFDDDIEEVVL